MGAERIRKAESKAEKPVNWNEILRLSFLFSQGYSPLQSVIFKYLMSGPLRGQNMSDDFFKKGMTSVYVEKLRKAGNHQSVEALTTEKLERNELIGTAAVKDEDRSPPKFYIYDVANLMIDRDYHFTVTKNGRPVTSEGNRDAYSSFLIDFGLLQKGTDPWPYDSLPEAYKEMWRNIMESISSQEVASSAGQLREMARKYLETHTDLSEEDRSKIQNLIDEVVSRYSHG